MTDWQVLHPPTDAHHKEHLRRAEGIDSGSRLEADAVFTRLRARFGLPPAV